MTYLTRSCPVLLAAVLAEGLAMSTGARAGDAIQFSNPGSRPAATRSSASAENAGNTVNFGGLRSFGPSPGPGAAPLPSGRRGDRRSKEAELERKNWMILNQGDLQGKDDVDAAFGLRPIVAPKSTADIWFSQKEAGSNRKATDASAPEENSAEPRAARPGLTQGLDLKLNDVVLPKQDGGNLLEAPGGNPATEKLDGSFGNVFQSALSPREATDPARLRGDFGLRSFGSLTPGSTEGRGEIITFGFSDAQRGGTPGGLANGSPLRPVGSLNPPLSPDAGSLRGSMPASPLIGDGAFQSRSAAADITSPTASPSLSRGPADFSRPFSSSFEVPSRPR